MVLTKLESNHTAYEPETDQPVLVNLELDNEVEVISEENLEIEDDESEELQGDGFDGWE